MFSNHILVLFIVAGIFVACDEPEVIEPVPEKFPGVDPQLKQYFQRFEDEAFARGFNVDLTAAGITGVIIEIEEEHVLGRCSFPRAHSNKVTVDLAFWSRGSDLFREFVVFHELGHCYLYRPHLEDRLSNGACSSIMRSGNGPCLDNYSLRTRDFYINELFNQGLQASAGP